MKLIDNEIINRYIYYLCRYIPYDKKELAKDEIMDILQRRLPIAYTDKDIKDELNRLGNPYEIGLKYSNKGNFLLNGKSYEIFISMIYMLFSAGTVSLILFFFNYFARISKLGFFEILQTIILTAFMLALIPSWICEKVKSTKILKTFMKAWSIDDLYESSSIKHSIYGIIFILIYSSMFFLLQLYTKTGNIEKSTYNIIILLFFINVLRDTLRISEDSTVSNIVYVAYIFDLLTISIFAILLKFAIPNIFPIRVIIFMNVVDILYMTVNLFRDKNIISLRKKRKRENRNRKYKKIDEDK